jgi:hypothetical protein
MAHKAGGLPKLTRAMEGVGEGKGVAAAEGVKCGSR